jgi:hypothetical protein
MAVATKAQVANLNIGGRRLSGGEYIAAVDDILVTNVKTAMDQTSFKPR